MEHFDAVVIGAGIAGLAAALELQRNETEVFVIDSSDRPGGVMRTDRIDGYVIERGPNSLQVKDPMRALLESFNIEAELIKAEPESKNRFVYHYGRLIAVPTSPLSLVGTPLLSVGAKLRMMAEPLIRKGDPSGESVSEFFTRRLGAQVATNLVSPLLTGVYAGDEDRLGVDAIFPALTAFERRGGSITFGALAAMFGKRAPRGLAGNWSGPNGLGPFAQRLSGLLKYQPTLGTMVHSIRKERSGYRIEMTGPGGDRELNAWRVVIATPAPGAAEILRCFNPVAANILSQIEYAPLVGVPVGVVADHVRTPIKGFGFLVHRDQNLSLLGCLFMSRIFKGRAPVGGELLQCLVGGTRWAAAVDEPDDVISKRVVEDLDRVLGFDADPRVLTVSRWRQAIPQPSRDHIRSIRQLREALSSHPGLALAGSYLDGISVSDTLATGLRAAWDVLGSHANLV